MSWLSRGDQRCTIITSGFLLTVNQVCVQGGSCPLLCDAGKSWRQSCPAVWGQPGWLPHSPWCPAQLATAAWHPTCEGACCLWDGLLWTQYPSGGVCQQLLLQTWGWRCHLQHSPDFRGFEIQWFVDMSLSCKTYLSGVSVYLLLIIPAPVSSPVLINLCQVRPQITCQIDDWVSPIFAWGFSKKGYHLPWVDYQSGLDYRGCMLCFFLPPWTRKVWSDSCRSVHALH